MLALLSLLNTACASGISATSGDCRIDGPLDLAPPRLGRLHHGMTKRQVDRIIGAPTYSPTAGQFYYPAGGDCPLDDPEGMSAPCGLVADYRLINANDSPPSITVTGKLEQCWWGAIAE